MAEPQIADEPEAPGENTFWQTYSPQLELPIASVASVFSHVFLVAIGVFIVTQSEGCFRFQKDKAGVPIMLIEGGPDAVGAGSQGSGDTPNPLAVGESAPQQKDFDNLPLPDALPQVQKELQERYAIEDPTGSITFSPEKAASYGALSDSLRDKLLGVGQKKGNGGTGTGDDGPGAGPGGTGADSTRARGLRWVLRFKTSSGRDYLDQLGGLGAAVAVPAPPDFKNNMWVFRDVTNPQKPKAVTPQDFREFSGQIQFCDFKRDSVVQVGEALRLDFVPPYFWAFFPKTLEDNLAHKEKSFQGKPADAIEETTFAIVRRDGKFEAVVVGQKLKR